jgi:hypothetical protein
MSYMEDDSGLVWWWNKYVGVAVLIGIIVVAGLVLYYDVPGQITRQQQAHMDSQTVISTKDFLYNGTLSTITYQYGYWGSIDSTKLTFLDGKEFTLGSQVICQIGEVYTITTEETTFKDNHVTTKTITINEKVSTDN